MSTAPPSKKNLDASDVLNWEYVIKIAVKLDDPPETAEEAMGAFSYDFTSTDDEERRNVMLCDIIKNATDHQSRAAAEEVLVSLSRLLGSDLELLRAFAKQNGVKLKRFR